ncbi:hypothetical protein C8R47DRAFT_1203985 [Mycena vitilis]|nr:hypothetical protein C8R47DRAFT_1203985 [Mycena vitilis]
MSRIGLGTETLLDNWKSELPVRVAMLCEDPRTIQRPTSVETPGYQIADVQGKFGDIQVPCLTLCYIQWNDRPTLSSSLYGKFLAQHIWILETFRALTRLPELDCLSRALRGQEHFKPGVENTPEQLRAETQRGHAQASPIRRSLLPSCSPSAKLPPRLVAGSAHRLVYAAHSQCRLVDSHAITSILSIHPPTSSCSHPPRRFLFAVIAVIAAALALVAALAAALAIVIVAGHRRRNLFKTWLASRYIKILKTSSLSVPLCSPILPLSSALAVLPSLLAVIVLPSSPSLHAALAVVLPLLPPRHPPRISRARSFAHGVSHPPLPIPLFLYHPSTSSSVHARHHRRSAVLAAVLACRRRRPRCSPLLVPVLLKFCSSRPQWETVQDLKLLQGTRIQDTSWPTSSRASTPRYFKSTSPQEPKTSRRLNLQELKLPQRSQDFKTSKWFNASRLKTSVRHPQDLKAPQALKTSKYKSSAPDQDYGPLDVCISRLQGASSLQAPDQAGHGDVLDVKTGAQSNGLVPAHLAYPPLARASTKCTNLNANFWTKRACVDDVRIMRPPVAAMEDGNVNEYAWLPYESSKTAASEQVYLGPWNIRQPRAKNANNEGQQWNDHDRSNLAAATAITSSPPRRLPAPSVHKPSDNQRSVLVRSPPATQSTFGASATISVFGTPCGPLLPKFLPLFQEVSVFEHDAGKPVAFEQTTTSTFRHPTSSGFGNPVSQPFATPLNSQRLPWQLDSASSLRVRALQSL